MPNPRQSKRKILAALVLGSIAVALSLFYREALPADSSVSHHQSYVDGLRLIEQQRFDEAKKALNEATGLPMLFPWATTALGHLEEARRNFDRAAAYFRAVPISSGAYPEAQLGLLRAGLETDTQSSELKSQLQNLELIIDQVRRSDLLPEVLTVKAIVAERANDSLTAAQLWREIRRSFPNTPAAKLAREQLLTLEAQTSPQRTATTTSLLDEAKQLLKEGELAKALELTQQARTLVAPETAAAFEALEVEEQILRNSGRTLEAETLLKTLAEQAPIGIGDLVLLRLAKKSWNTNQTAEVLSLAERFFQRFPNSPLGAQILFIKASTLADAGRLADAIEVAKGLRNSASDQREQLRAAKFIAWSLYKMNNRREALIAFRDALNIGSKIADTSLGQIRSISTKPLSARVASDKAELTKLIRLVRDITDENLQAQLLIAHLLKAEQQITSFVLPEGFDPPDLILQKILERAPSSYYAVRAAEALKQAPLSHISLLLREKGGCLNRALLAEQQWVEELKSLSPLRDLAQREIEYRFRYTLESQAQNNSLSTALDGERQFTRESFGQALAMIRLMQLFGAIEKGSALADTLWKRPLALDNFNDETNACLGELTLLAFPQGFEREVRENSSAQSVPSALIWAIARTESFFKADAASNMNAQGLMQLIPSTAKEEGIKDSESLFDPRVNIRLGTQHLRGLLERFGSVEVAAAAYNAGAKHADRWLAKTPTNEMPIWVEAITFPETRDYVKKVILAKAVYEAITH